MPSLLETLPPEVLNSIIEDESLSSVDRLSLSLTSSWLHALAGPLIYREFTLGPFTDSKTQEVAIEKFQIFCARIRKNQSYARQVRVVEVP